MRLDLEIDDDGSGPATAAAPPGRIASVAAVRRRPQVLAVRSALCAGEVLEQFRQHRDTWYDAQWSPFVVGIESLLEEEARLSDVHQGLPGLDHPELCRDGVCSFRGSALAPEEPLTARLHVWQPDIWWMSPIVRRHDRPLNLRLPLADDPRSLVDELTQRLPPAWQHDRVVVQLEVETRIYWGACGLNATPDQGAEGWTACSFRGDGVAASEDLFKLHRGTLTWLSPQEGARAPLIRRTLRPGLGLLVAIPIFTFERQEGPAGWLKRLGQQWLRWFGWKQPVIDRDPTWLSRLQADETYWARALDLAPPSREGLEEQIRLGARLAPASRLACGHDPAFEAAADAHVVLIHGTLSSVRGAWSDWLSTDHGPMPPAGPWRGMPLLDSQCVWRFEHDTFLRMNRNINQLVDALERQIIGRRQKGTLVFLAHSRGGNVARFALSRVQQRWPGWRFEILAVGSPHLGTRVFRQFGRRWSGLAGVVGAVRDVASGWLDKQHMTDLLILERALAYDIPPGFRDVEPEGVARMARGQALPAQMTVWGSQWGPPATRLGEAHLWHRVIEDFAGFEADGDGIVPLYSSKPQGLAQSFDASPSFHTGYFAHPATVAQIRAELERRLPPVALAPG